MKIDELIEKYINGETSLEEEKDLKKYLLNAKVLPQQNYLKQIFKYMQKEKDTIKLSEAETKQLEENLLNNRRKILRIMPYFQIKSKYIIYAAAALAFIIIGLFTLNYLLKESQKAIVINNTNISEKKEIALQETERALSIVSQSLNNVYYNLEKLDYIEQSIEKLRILELINYKQN